MLRIPALLRRSCFSRKSRRSSGITRNSESLEVRTVLSADPLPVLMVIADQHDFYFKEYADTRASLESAGVEVVVAATTTNPSLPHWNSGQGWLSGEVTPDIALNQVDAADYSAIAFVGGWGSSMYQYSTFTGDYANNLYDGDLATKLVVNELINEFVAADKYLGFICHATTIGAWSRVNGTSLFEGRQVSVPYIGSPAVFYNNVWYGDQQLGQYEQAIANGATANTVSGQYGVPGTAVDDVVTDEYLITAENWDSASLFGTTIAQLVIAAANPPQPNQAPVAGDVQRQMAEHSAAGTPVAQVNAVDPDAGQSLTWQITGGNAGGAFQINPATGQIVVANPAALDFETHPVFVLTVEVTDNDNENPLSDTAVVTVFLTDVMEAPPASVYQQAGDLIVQGSSGPDTIYVWSSGTDHQVGIWMNGIAYGTFSVPAGSRVLVSGEDGNDQIYATDCRRPVQICGGAGHDQITGGSANDMLDGGDGVDRIWAAAGNDLVLGGDGNDYLYGREGSDLIVGGPGGDTIDGFDGNDVLIGGFGSDYIKAGAGDDLLIGGTTQFDSSPALLSALAQLWNAMPAAAAAAELRNGSSSGIRLRRGLEVLDDQTQDIMCSGSGVDLFYDDAADALWSDELDLFAAFN